MYLALAMGAIAILYFLSIYWRTGVPYVPTTDRYVPTILAALQITPATVMYDLGSGTGKVLFAAERYGAKHLVGFELSPLHAQYARLKARILTSQVIIHQEDFFRADLSAADIVYVFLVPTVVARVWEYLQTHGKSGARMVVLGDQVAGVTPEQIIRLGEKSRAFVYRIVR